ncbi:MAG: hypothetical protein JJE49_03850 [Peptostreptococcaceae bacterium]|nr:hypothetical protein [Peptostreptococcaceae bacterium]
MEKVIISGVPLKYIEFYLAEIADSIKPGGLYVGPDWEIQVVCMKDKRFRNITIPQTKIIFISDADTLEGLVHRFRMKFMSAGG